MTLVKKFVKLKSNQKLV